MRRFARCFVDRHDPGFGEVCDLFTLTEPVDNIISNVPYKIAEPCARHMIGLARRKVALILPMIFWESRRRDRFFRDYPPIRWFPCSDRPSMPPGTTSGERNCYGAIIQPPSSGGTMPYGWFIFERGFRGITSAMRLPLKNGKSRWSSVGHQVAPRHHARGFCPRLDRPTQIGPGSRPSRWCRLLVYWKCR
jgi:hypothetical protein